MSGELPSPARVAIEELLPHRGTMLLLDRVIDHADSRLVAEYTPRADAWYADAAGNMPGWLGIELMAQTVAAQVALCKRRAGLPLKMGALLGTRAYRMAAPAAGGFAAGAALRIRVEENFRDAGGLSAYECAIERDDETLANATLKVYEPDDFGDFLQGAAA